MVFLKFILAVLLVFLLFTAASALPVDDKSSDRPILASERKKVEKLISQAAAL